MLVYDRIRAAGRFSLPEGELIPDFDVPVEIEQLGSGSTFLCCCNQDEPAFLRLMTAFGPAASFVGHTRDGLPIRTSELRTYVGQRADRHFYPVSRVISGDPAAGYSSVELAITNLVFDTDSKQGTSFRVSVGDSPLLIELVPAENYDDLLFHLRQTHCPTVTAKLRMAPCSLSIDALNSLVEDVGATLSIIQGRKIEWVQRTAYSPKGSVAWSELAERTTKNYTHGFLCADSDKGTGVNLPFDGFESAYPKVREFHHLYDPDRRIVNSWLDARLQEDFLEARTLKYAIVLETLCRLVESVHADIPSNRVPKSKWRSTGEKFLPLIKDHLATSFGLDSLVIDNVCNKQSWGDLNRAGFRTTLAECLQKLGISMHDGSERIQRVTRVRDKIVHFLNYLSVDDIKKLKWPAISESQQHFLVACFVEEALLRLFGLGDHVSESWIAGFRAHGRQPGGQFAPSETR